jgi:aspartate/methionine/tyrosine aminotransferase
LSEIGLRLGDEVLCYADHRGNPKLRELIAAQTAGGCTAGDVLVTAGAAGALFIIATSVLEPGDHIVVVRPNYATNIETPKAIGCRVSYLDLKFEAGFQLDLDALGALVEPTTRLISVTTPHNPTGVMLGEATLRAIIELAEKRGCRVLVDETYADMTFDEKPPSAVSMSERIIAVSSLSKTYGVPGIRVGWVVCRDPALMQLFLAAKEQIGICGSVVDESIALQVLSSAASWRRQNDERLRVALQVVRGWMASEPLMEWVEPRGGCVCFPRMRAEAAIDVDRFYESLNGKYGTYVGPGHWFGMPRTYMRIGFGWPLPEELCGGLESISRALQESR